MTHDNTSKLFIPYLSQFRATYQKARRSVKKRISTEGEVEKPEINQYWERSNSNDSLYRYVVETDPFMVQFLEPNTSRNDAYQLNDVKFEVLPEDFVRKVKDPHLVAVGRNRVNYVF